MSDQATKGLRMLRLREATSRGLDTLSRAIRQQPDYDSEVSDEYLDELARLIDSAKPATFSLKAISEPGW